MHHANVRVTPRGGEVIENWFGTEDMTGMSPAATADPSKDIRVSASQVITINLVVGGMRTAPGLVSRVTAVAGYSRQLPPSGLAVHE